MASLSALNINVKHNGLLPSKMLCHTPVFLIVAWLELTVTDISNEHCLNGTFYGLQFRK